MIGWDTLQRHVDEISLIVTDIEMPNLDGFELMRKIKQDNRYAHLPVIALTTLADDKDRMKARKLGVEEYHIKLDRENLLKTIKKYIITL
jgi:two-component system chemotaxis sensor kinase CheA